MKLRYKITDMFLGTFDFCTRRMFWTVITIEAPLAEVDMSALSSWLSNEIGEFKYDLRGFTIIDENQTAKLSFGFRRKEDAVYFKLVWA